MKMVGVLGKEEKMFDHAGASGENVTIFMSMLSQFTSIGSLVMSELHWLIWSRLENVLKMA